MIKMISWFGTMVSIIGAFCVASQIFLAGYILFSLGSISWLYVGIVKKDSALYILNGTFFLANILGLFNSLKG